MKIVCIGFPKTGTTSMERALEVLGYKVCKGHFQNGHSNYLMGLFANGDYPRILKMLECFDAFADAPWGGTDLYRHVEAKYPDTRFILTTRDTQAWLKSLKRMFLAIDPEIETAFGSFYKSGAYGFCDYFRTVFKTDSLVDADNRLCGVYDAFNAEAAAHFAGRDNFLHFPLEQAAWEPLCRFLGKPVPTAEFPRMNVAAPSEQRQGLTLTLTEAYHELIARLAANDEKALGIILPLLLKHDRLHFAQLLKSGLTQEQSTGRG